MERLYFAGQRLIPPGGLPIALVTGRAAVEKLCEDEIGAAICAEHGEELIAETALETLAKYFS